MMNRHIRVQAIRIPEFTGMLKKNRILIPSFQREFVWERADVIKLWESLYRFYPIGSILCWETNIRLNIHRKVGGFIFKNCADLSGEPRKRIYILDGQQRATALLMPLAGRQGKPEGTLGGRGDFDYGLYFDATDETFFFSHELNRRKRKVPPAFLVPLSEMVQKGRAILNAAFQDPLFDKTIEKNIEQLAHIFSEYCLSLIYIEGFDIPAVREIFERINQEGKDLSSMDIMISRTFRDYEYLVEEDL